MICHLVGVYIQKFQLAPKLPLFGGGGKNVHTPKTSPFDHIDSP
jgi:hypothetical protein